MVSTRLRIGAAVLALYAAFPITVHAEEPAVSRPEKYVDPDAQALRDHIAGMKAKLEELKKKNIPEDTKRVLVEAAQANIDEAESDLAPEVRGEKAVNRKSGKIYRDQLEILKVKDEIMASNLAWAEAKANGTEFTPENIRELKSQQERRIQRLSNLENRIGRKKKGIKRLGSNYDELLPKKAEKPVLETSKPVKTLPQTLTDAEKRKKPGCWEKGEALPKTIVKYFDLGKDDFDPSQASKLGEDREAVDSDFLSQVSEMKKNMQMGPQVRIAQVEIVAHNSKIPSKTKSPESLANGRQYQAVQEFQRAVSDGKKGEGVWLEAFAPSGPFAESFIRRDSTPIDVGPNYEPGMYEAHKTKVVKRRLPECSTDGDASGCLATAVCLTDDVCKRAQSLFQNRQSSPSPALVLNADGTMNLKDTMKNLEKCCSANISDLRFKPHQYVEMKVYPARFAPDSPSCVDLSKVATQEKKGSTGEVTPSGTVETKSKPALPKTASEAN